MVDPVGSGLYDYVKSGFIEDETTVHGFKTTYVPRSEGLSITEGIGVEHLTDNFKLAKLDGGMQVSDLEAVEMAYYLKHWEGLSVGPSAALNVTGAVKLA